MSMPHDLSRLGFPLSTADQFAKNLKTQQQFGILGFHQLISGLMERVNPVGGLVDSLSFAAKSVLENDRRHNMSGFHDMLRGISERNYPNLNMMTGLSIGASLAKQSAASLGMLSGIGSAAAAITQANRPPISPLVSLRDSLTSLVKENQTWNQDWSKMMRGQLGITTKLNALEPMLKWSGTIGTAGLGDTLSYLTSEFIGSSDQDSFDDDFDTIDEMNTAISLHLEGIAVEEGNLSLEEKIQAFLDIAFELLEGISFPKPGKNIAIYISVFSAIVGVLSFYNTMSNMSNDEIGEALQDSQRQTIEQLGAIVQASDEQIIEEVGEQINDSKKETAEEVKMMIEDSKHHLEAKIDSVADLMATDEQRTTKVKAVLYLEACARSESQGYVFPNQVVTVIDEQERWLYVYFTDNETDRPRIGYVYKRHFKVIEPAVTQD